MSTPTPEAVDRPEATLFEEYFDRVMALAHQRMEVEWTAHRRADLQRLRPELLEIHREFGALLRVVFRYGLTDVLREEVAGYATSLAYRQSPHDAMALLLDSWIVAMQGLIRPPECHVLTAPLQRLRDELPDWVCIPPSASPLPPQVEAMMGRLVVGDRAGAEAVMRGRLAAGVPPWDVVPELILAAMAEIGSRWERNELTIYQEHLATETVIRLLAGWPSAVTGDPPLHRLALVSCVPDDHIQLVPLALAVYLELRGWNAMSLGHGLPADQIAAAAEAFRPDAVFLSLAMVARLPGALETVERLARLSPRPVILVGGRGARQARVWLQSAGAEVPTSFDDGHQRALTMGGPHA